MANSQELTRLVAPQFVSNSPTPPVAKQQFPVRKSGDVDSLKHVIRDLGLKVTKQRLVILKAIQEGRSHVTAQEVYETINKEHPEIGFATVYRFLRALSEHGFITEIRMGGLPARYEWADKDHHDHLTCVRCGLIREFENKTIEELQEQISKKFGFMLTDHVLELYGICPACQIQQAQST